MAADPVTTLCVQKTCCLWYEIRTQSVPYSLVCVHSSLIRLRRYDTIHNEETNSFISGCSTITDNKTMSFLYNDSTFFRFDPYKTCGWEGSGTLPGNSGQRTACRSSGRTIKVKNRRAMPYCVTSRLSLANTKIKQTVQLWHAPNETE